MGNKFAPIWWQILAKVLILLAFQIMSLIVACFFPLYVSIILTDVGSVNEVELVRIWEKETVVPSLHSSSILKCSILCSSLWTSGHHLLLWGEKHEPLYFACFVEEKENISSLLLKARGK